MSSITNVNNESTVVNVGRTTPVQPGVQPATGSIPVVVASDQTPIPVEEQNKIQSEVALSLLGIPRAEVALGIFADVNTYDVNPTEWSTAPQNYITGYGVKHLPSEAGALVEAPVNKTSVLTSKRFFRYQPGRVSAATFGVKSSVSSKNFIENPAIRKFGIYDNFDGYFWETRNNANGDNFSVVRRSQSLLKCPTSPTGIAGQYLKGSSVTSGRTVMTATQIDDYRIIGQGTKETASEATVLFAKDRALITKNRFKLVDDALTAATGAYNASAGTQNVNPPGVGTTVNGYEITTGNYTAAGAGSFYADLALAIDASTSAPNTSAAIIEAKCKRDLDYWIDMYLLDMEYGGNMHTKLNTTNYASGIFPDIVTFEQAIHSALKVLLVKVGDLATLSTTGAAKLLTLTEITEDAFGGSAGVTSQLGVTTVEADNYGNRSAIDTIFSAKMHYWAYVVASVTQNTTLGTVVMDNATGGFTCAVSDIDVGDYVTVSGTGSVSTMTSATYEVSAVSGGTVNARTGFTLKTVGTPTVASAALSTSAPASLVVGTAGATTGLIFTALGNGVAITLENNDTGYKVPASGLSSGLTPVDIKYKCQRDLGYIIDGYRNDIAGGGEAETKYNMSMYFKDGRGTSPVQGGGMSIYSQTESSILEEIERHTHLAAYIKTDLLRYGILPTSAEYLKLTALSSRVIANFLEEDTFSMVLGNRGFAGNLVAMRDGLIVTHAAVYDPTLLKPIESIHAVASVDATVITIGTLAPATTCKFRLSKGHVTFGQHVKLKYTSTGTEYGALKKDTIYKVVRVYGPKGNEFLLKTTTGTIALLEFTTTQRDNAGAISFELVVPFIFPKDQYDPAAYGLAAGGADDQNPIVGDDNFPEGMVFPYMYSNDDNLIQGTAEDSYRTGYINTAMDIGVVANLDVMCTEIDKVNFEPEYINWIKNNVQPEFYGVYDYRVPRSRFSHDTLDGIRATATPKPRSRVYSDLATGEKGIARPGQPYTVDDITQTTDSLYKFDFTKVTMLKIEFSWYGAVGALFLAYVPVENGEARWVRVHHLRASNQMKISSLGNATLPITYTVYGGGDEQSLGLTSAFLTPDQGYGGSSDNIVKYGASYYIDGGDRGTVRLYSHNNENQASAYGKQWAVSGDLVTTEDLDGVDTPSIAVNNITVAGIVKTAVTVTATATGGVFTCDAANIAAGDFITISGTIGGATITGYTNPTTYKISDVTGGSAGARLGFTLETIADVALTTTAGTTTGVTFNRTAQNILPAFFMGATLKTNNSADQNIKVIFANATRVFLSTTPAGTSGFTFLADRANSTYGLETKKVILSASQGNAVRNRVQVYPTKLSTSNTGPVGAKNPVRLRFKKTPVFQTSAIPNGTLKLSADYTVDAANPPLVVTESASSPLTYLIDGEEIYGWFRATVDVDKVTIFGRLYKDAGSYYFEMLQSFNGTVILKDDDFFLPDKRWTAQAAEMAGTTVTKFLDEKEGLSSVKIATNSVVPIPGTGINVATIYLQEGTEQLDLSPYFDYNKEYLSFPLTDQADTLYFTVDSDTASTASEAELISLGVTWEEQ